MKYVYPRLKDLREDANEIIKQDTIAKMLGTTQQQYSRWERGAQEVPFHIVIKLSVFYNVSIDYIAGLTNNKKGGIKR